MSLNNDEKKLEERVAELEREMGTLSDKMDKIIGELQGLRKDQKDDSESMKTMWCDMNDKVKDRKQREEDYKNRVRLHSELLEFIALPVSERKKRLEERKEKN